MNENHDPLCPPGLKAATPDRCAWCLTIEQARREGPHRPGTGHDNLCPAANLDDEWNGEPCQCQLLHAAREAERAALTPYLRQPVTSCG